jgi:hypothetical protein
MVLHSDKFSRTFGDDRCATANTGFWYRFFFGLVSSGAYLLCGFYLLKLRESARKAAVILGVISIVSMPFFLVQISKAAMFNDYSATRKQIILQNVKPEYQQAALDKIPKENEIAKKVFAGMMIAFSLPLLALEIIPIYFFTRQRVREQFN